VWSKSPMWFTRDWERSNYIILKNYKVRSSLHLRIRSSPFSVSYRSTLSASFPRAYSWNTWDWCLIMLRMTIIVESPFSCKPWDLIVDTRLVSHRSNRNSWTYWRKRHSRVRSTLFGDNSKSRLSLVVGIICMGSSVSSIIIKLYFLNELLKIP
jgi:hypothetical protein